MVARINSPALSPRGSPSTRRRSRTGATLPPSATTPGISGGSSGKRVIRCAPTTRVTRSAKTAQHAPPSWNSTALDALSGRGSGIALPPAIDDRVGRPQRLESFRIDQRIGRAEQQVAAVSYRPDDLFLRLPAGANAEVNENIATEHGIESCGRNRVVHDVEMLETHRGLELRRGGAREGITKIAVRKRWKMMT